MNWSSVLRRFRRPKPAKPPPASEQVVRLLRCVKTRRFYNHHGWTTDPADAAKFRDEAAALREIALKNLTNVELVLKVPGSNIELSSGPIT